MNAENRVLAALVVCIAGLVPTTVAAATTFYVGATGNDANSCVQAQNIGTPRRTIGAGLTCVGAGDTLLIRGGTYSENINSNAQRIPTGSSWADAPRIAAYAGEVVSLGYLSLGAPSSAGQATIQYVVFDGFRFVNPTTTNDTVAFWGAVHHVRVQNSDVSGAKNAHSGINTKPGNGGGGYIEILNTTVHHNGDCSVSCTSGTVGHGLYISTSYNLFDGIEVYSNGHLGLQIYFQNPPPGPSNNVVRNSTFHDNQVAYTTSGRGISVGVGSNNAIYNNVIYSNLGGIQVGYGGSGNQVYNNTITNNRGDGIVIDSNSSSDVVQNNIVYNNSGTAIKNSGVGTVSVANLTIDPKFVDPARLDFRLQSGSAAVDSGVAVAMVKTDINGIARPQGGAYDLGAYEYGAASAFPSAPSNVRLVSQ